jgi:hypothetical protein
MSNYTSIAHAVSQANTTVDEAVNHACQLLDQCPENPAASNLANNPRCFTVSSSSLLSGNNWSVFFHDWRAQFNVAKELLMTRKFGTLAKMLEGASVEGQNFAPEVIEHIKRVVGSLPS